jgi:hypothetical protein
MFLRNQSVRAGAVAHAPVALRDSAVALPPSGATLRRCHSALGTFRLRRARALVVQRHMPWHASRRSTARARSRGSARISRADRCMHGTPSSTDPTLTRMIRRAFRTAWTTSRLAQSHAIARNAARSIATPRSNCCAAGTCSDERDARTRPKAKSLMRHFVCCVCVHQHES